MRERGGNSGLGRIALVTAAGHDRLNFGGVTDVLECIVVYGGGGVDRRNVAYLARVGQSQNEANDMWHRL